MKRKFLKKLVITFLVIFAFTVSPVLAMTYSYDDLGRLTSVTYNSGQTTTYSYDSAGNMLSITNSVVSEALTVSNPSTTGFTVALSPALNGLTTSNFILLDTSSNAVTITGAVTMDNGATYAISSALSAGQTYTITATDTGYEFGTAQSVVVPAATYTVTYNGNGSTSGSVPVDNNNYPHGTSVTVLDNTGNLVKTGYIFAGWNTATDGSGTPYAAGATFAMGTANVTLYAQWTANPTYTVTFTVTDGSNPIQGATVTLGGVNITTDNNGQASFDLANGTYSYTVSSAGMQDASGSVTVNGAAITQTVTMSPQA